ncbi:Smr/MutS family endonuclease [Chitinibacter sp. SCUT-21]|uniref:Smr/MutS family protein n=1 Tax=Chitinibacter sp. SCUT-21 TaxID=2970891 RepID=UPI0035A68BB4
MDKKSLSMLKQFRKGLTETSKLKKTLKPSARQISEHDLFLQAMHGVTPLLKATREATHVLDPISPWPRKQIMQHIETHENMSDFWPWDELGPGEQLMFMKPGLRLDVLKKLKKGQWSIDDQLDLHGETVDSARHKVVHFLAQAIEQQYRCVRIIHGKGLSSKEGVPILKLKLKNWLAQREEVLAFTQANPTQGCSGAVLVLLKSRKKHL